MLDHTSDCRHGTVYVLQLLVVYWLMVENGVYVYIHVLSIGERQFGRI